MKRWNWYLILVAVLSLLLAGSLMACTQPEEEPSYASEEARQIEEAQFGELYRQMKSYVERADTLALGLGNVTWGSLSRLGWISTDAYGNETKHMLTNVMPAAEAAAPLLAECERSYARAVKVWSERPYKEAQSALEQARKLSVSQWQELCDQLDSALEEAEDQASHLNNVTEELFLDVEAGIKNSGKGAEQQYLENFQNESAEYTDVLDEIRYNLEQARQTASELASWSFTSLPAAAGSAPPTEPPPASETQPSEEPSLEAWSAPDLPRGFQSFRAAR